MSDIIKRLEEDLTNTDNDFKALALHKQIIREKNSDRAQKYIDALAKAGYPVTFFEDKGKVMIEETQFGIVDYYPKANKILIRKQSKWISAGAHWIIKNLLDDIPPE